MENLIPISELEKRMRPGAYSRVGFLGSTESLESVLLQDEQALLKIGISPEVVAKELEDVLNIVLVIREKLSKENFKEYWEREHHTVYWNKQSAPLFSLDNLPSPRIGFFVDKKYQALFIQTKGLQECPWGCEYVMWSSFDFLLLNLQTGKYITAPGLIVHLIRKHHFFEGVESPYRVDPIGLAQVLGLVSKT